MQTITLVIGVVRIRAAVRDTPTAGFITRELPLHTRAERWGRLLQFETHADAGIEPSASDVIGVGEVAYIPHSEKIVLAFGPTPISRSGEVRLMGPANVWADAIDDVATLAGIRGGEPVQIIG